MNNYDSLHQICETACSCGIAKELARCCYVNPDRCVLPPYQKLFSLCPRCSCTCIYSATGRLLLATRLSLPSSIPAAEITTRLLLAAPKTLATPECFTHRLPHLPLGISSFFIRPSRQNDRSHNQGSQRFPSSLAEGVVNVKIPSCQQTQFSIKSFVYDSKQMLVGVVEKKCLKKGNDQAICFTQLWSVREKK